MIKMLPPKSYGEIKPLVNPQGQPIRTSIEPAPPPKIKRRRLHRSGPRPEAQRKAEYHV